MVPGWCLEERSARGRSQARRRQQEARRRGRHVWQSDSEGRRRETGMKQKTSRCSSFSLHNPLSQSKKRKKRSVVVSLALCSLPLSFAPSSCSGLLSSPFQSRASHLSYCNQNEKKQRQLLALFESEIICSFRSFRRPISNATVDVKSV